MLPETDNPPDTSLKHCLLFTSFPLDNRMQTRLEASSLVHSAVSRSVPFESEDIVPAVKVANANVPVMNKTLRVSSWGNCCVT